MALVLLLWLYVYYGTYYIYVCLCVYARVGASECVCVRDALSMHVDNIFLDGEINFINSSVIYSGDCTTAYASACALQYTGATRPPQRKVYYNNIRTMRRRTVRTIVEYYLLISLCFHDDCNVILLQTTTMNEYYCNHML